jgi:hypothetical protein
LLCLNSEWPNPTHSALFHGPASKNNASVTLD